MPTQAQRDLLFCGNARMADFVVGVASVPSVFICKSFVRITVSYSYCSV